MRLPLGVDRKQANKLVPTTVIGKVQITSNASVSILSLISASVHHAARQLAGLNGSYGVNEEVNVGRENGIFTSNPLVGDATYLRDPTGRYRMSPWPKQNHGGHLIL